MTKFANAPVGLVEMALNGIVLALLETGVDACQGSVSPAFELVYRHRNLTRNRVNRLTTQQSQHDFLLPARFISVANF
ncbi:MAG TPA: hypothetical protein PLS67_11600 [Accumulibacter sp.]|jgi:hypothetical protein|nr:hypothetical protein [Accumulibacter sp.]HQC81139.1 hypothetical protein [Accumulibacter sp.]